MNYLLNDGRYLTQNSSTLENSDYNEAWDAYNHICLVKNNGWLCFTSHKKRGYFETAPPFTVPCDSRGARFLHRPHRESNPGSLRG